MAWNPLSTVLRHQALAGLSRNTRYMPSLIPLRSITKTIQPYEQLRRFSSPSIPRFFIGSPSSHSLTQKRSLWGSGSLSMSSSSAQSHLAHMEQSANNNPKSATAQNAFYSALLRANRPDLVARRYESGKFASNPAFEALYMRSLDRLNSSLGSSGQSSATVDSKTDLGSEAIRSVAQGIGARFAGTQSGYGNTSAGSKKNPVHIVLEETAGMTVFRWIRFLLSFALTLWMCYVAITLFFALTDGGGGLLRRVGGKSFEAKPEVQKTRFSDVHGCEEAKEELQEVVDFLKSPDKYSTLGGKLPKGILLVGPPGTGKTLLARAVAGEAGVPFFYMSGSEFDEVYVGVGAKRVRELFNAARTKAPAIVFIDELDAIGGKRNERDAAYAKQTLNQLLTDLDGFNQDSGVIFLAATNFPELLDKALTRPGRFDRQVVVPLPDVRGRIAILKHYMKSVNVSPEIDASIVARGTPGFSGAELENLTNSAAIHASKRKAKLIEMIDFEWAKDKLLMGAERRSAVIQEKDKIMTAYHEGGHALVAMFTPFADPLYKATIMPRGHALGITFQLPEMDKVSMAKREYEARLDVCMGGKVAEEIIYGKDATTGGSSNDISAATSTAYAMVTQLGMSPRLGNVDLHSDYGRLPTETKQLIWEEVRRLIEESKLRAETILTERRKELELLATALVEYETLGKDEMELVIKGKKPPDAIKSFPEAPIKLPDIPVSVGPQPPSGGGIAIPGPEPHSGSEPPRPYPVS